MKLDKIIFQGRGGELIELKKGLESLPNGTIVSYGSLI